MPQLYSGLTIHNDDTGETKIAICGSPARFHNPDGAAHNYSVDAGTGVACTAGPDTDFSAFPSTPEGPGAFTIPLETAVPTPPVPNYVQWIVGESTLWQDLAKTIPAVNVNDPIRVWTDASGNGHDMIAPSDAARPKLRPAQVNGKRAIRFDGANDTMDAVFNTAQPWSLYIVFKTAAPAADNRNILAEPGLFNYPYTLVGALNRFHSGPGFGIDDAYTNADTDLSFTLFSIAAVVPTSRCRFINASNDVTRNTSTPQLSPWTQPTFANDGGGNFTALDITAALLYDFTHTQQQQDDTVTFLRDLYGI